MLLLSLIHNALYNVVPGDYTHDGKLDLLVMSQGASNTQLSLLVYTSTPGGGFCRLFPPVLNLFDSDSQMRVDLLGLQPGTSQLGM
jgi:integrin alpha FG-GAP repeat containing protein 1